VQACVRSGAPLRSIVSPAPVGCAALALLLPCAAATARRMYVALFSLCRALSPRWRAPQEAVEMPWARILLALALTQAALLCCALRMALSSRVRWAGGTYERQRGRVRRLA